ncbi:hypothetical protein BDV12DRAFT_178296 [Aspergillus spectabilis]
MFDRNNQLQPDSYDSIILPLYQALDKGLGPRLTDSSLQLTHKSRNRTNTRGHFL